MEAEFQFNPRIAAKFIGNAYRADKTGTAEGSYFERIVTALLRDRLDWLPEGCPGILPALHQLVAHDEDWFHMMIEVSRMGLTDPNRDRGEIFA